MSLQQNHSSRIIFVSILFLASISVGISYATYKRLNDRISENHILSERFQKRLQKSITDNSEAISFLSRQKVHPVVGAETGALNYKKIIKQVNAQNSVISKVLDHYDNLQEEIKRIKKHGPASGNLSIVTTTDGLYGDGGNEKIAQQAITIEDLEQEVVLANKQSEELKQKTEAVFQSQTREGFWASKTNLEIENALEKIRVDPKFSGLGVNNIDCRESICKVEILHSNIQQLEEFDLLFLLEVSGDQPITTTAITNPLEDGGFSNTYYLSIN